MMHLTDTSPEAERILAQIHRDMPFEQKWRQMGDLYRMAKVFHASGLLSRNPQATQEDIRQDWIRVTLGDELCRTLKEAADGVRR